MDNKRKLVVGGIYRHFKGSTCHVVAVAKHTETKETLVIYECKGADGTDHGVFARPVAMFLSEVDHNKYPDVKQKYRLVLIAGGTEETDGAYYE